MNVVELLLKNKQLNVKNRVSRSSTVIISYLMVKKGMGFKEAFDYTKGFNFLILSISFIQKKNKFC